MNKPEILAPAGNLERLKIAIAYGADAVYMGGKQFGLRAFANNFTPKEMEEGVRYAHKRDKKVYVTLNIFPRNEDFDGMEEYLKTLSSMGVDALIVSDPGILTLIKESAPELEIHMSTQANNTNWRSANFWHQLGVKRIILARELSLGEIRDIRNKTPDSLELEAFVHGAMCMSYSGRCTISNYLTGRDANRGECAQPCRWKYHVVEEKRPGEYFPLAEDDKGTYLFNSKDLCMIGHIPDLVGTGLASLKIEGRMKTSYYVANVVSAYRKELDRYFRGKEEYQYQSNSLVELGKASHRPFTTGFYYNEPDKSLTEYKSSNYIRDYDFVGLYVNYLGDKNLMLVEQRNSFSIGDELEIMQPNEDFLSYEVKAMYNENLEPIEIAPHPQQKIYLPIDRGLKPWSIFRRKK
ncbi:MAG TPA: U32 family peptidase [Bacillota bacterium]|nr:U32 family peptidase [Bacillota bacterium]